MKNTISILLLSFVAFSINAAPMIDVSIYQQALKTKELKCENCAEVASAILSMHQRLCGIVLNESSYVEVKNSHIYDYALKEVSVISEDKHQETFILALQKGANCVDEESWEKRAAYYYKRLSRANKKPKRSLLFWRDEEE